jgi:hypothetical protein
MLERLSAIHPAFAQWNKQAETRETANEPFCAMPPNVDELIQIFEKNRRYRDATGEAWPEIGYWVGAWNGIDDANGISITVKAGDYSDKPMFPNWVEIDPHPQQPGNERLLSAETLKPVLLSVAAAWEPAWGSVSTWEYWTKRFPSPQRWPVFRSGWMTYLSSPYARKITPPASAITEPVAGGGILMLATNEPFDVGNPQHVAVADAIQACLEPLQANPLLGTAP